MNKVQVFCVEASLYLFMQNDGLRFFWGRKKIVITRMGSGCVERELQLGLATSLTQRSEQEERRTKN